MTPIIDCSPEAQSQRETETAAIIEAGDFGEQRRATIRSGGMSRSLFALAEDVRALDALIEDLGGDVTDPQVRAAWEAMQRELGLNEGSKLDGYVNWLRQLEMEASAAREEAERYLAKARSRQNRIEWLKGNLKSYLQATGRMRVETSTRRVIAIQANGGNVPIIIDDNLDPSLIPDELAIVRRTPDMEAIRKRLANGERLEFARLGERGMHLRVR